MPVSWQMSVWNSYIACSVPWLTSGWYGVYDVANSARDMIASTAPQAMYEFQTLICQLTGMEVANAGVYDGASATAEAVLMSRRIQPPSRRRVLMSRALHPHYREV